MIKEKLKNQPPAKNDICEIEIDDIGTSGEGVGKINGFTVFVNGAVAGDRALVHILKVKKAYGYGKVLKIIRPSELRGEAKCPYAAKCGGCQLQFMNYRAQLDFKTKKVKDCLERIGKFKNINVYNIIGMDDPFHYRNKGQFPAGMKNGAPAIGLYSPNSHNIVNIDGCLIQKEITCGIIETVRNFIIKFEIEIYNEISHAGLLRHVLIRTGHFTNEIMVCMVINGNNLPNAEKLVEQLIKIPDMKSISVNINKAKSNVVLGPEIRTLWGSDFITDCIEDLSFKISPLSFFQVNSIQMSVLYKKILECLNLSGRESVVDLYCGIGTISLYVSRHCKEVYGIECVEQSIIDAKDNAALNGISNAEFYEGDAFEVLSNLFAEKHICPDTVILDPPRKGISQALIELIIHLNPEKIVYVSCDPATLARDLYLLCKEAYSVSGVWPVDLFPHTVHVETVTLIQRKDC